MKACLLLALAGVTIGLAGPALAEQKAIADPALIAQLQAHSKGWDDAMNTNSLDAVLALYTDDAVEVTNQGPIVGRDAIKKRYEDMLKVFHVSNHVGKIFHSYPIGSDGNAVWSDGEYTFTARYKNEKPMEYKGYWSSISVREGDVWRDRMQTWNVAEPPAGSPSPADISGKDKAD